MAEDKLLYSTRVHNDQGLKGTAWVEGENELRVQTSSPLKADEPGTNPEQLIALSWATCLNATIEIALDRHGIKDVTSEVAIQVDYKLNQETSITYFVFKVDIYIDLARNEADAIVYEAESRCPVSQIIGDYQHVEIVVHAKDE
ncbi:OsmC family protein [Aerococcus urinaeequi]|uniref:Osmotically inducible protein OsmC n=1 Tax=Aerococcus urinaeequi TaxID=51665 RepID=A0AAC8X153_9LACT|nr:OsmC family protein [Aerococcus urinaeequi]AMB97809.1 osmotically inducible protein OsmC [Aerococcus urinaeequi]MDT2761691.1 OsmC family protein [Aerococcus urinaeequi]